MPIDRVNRGLAAAVLLASMLALSGCSSTIADMAMPADAPARQKDAGGYLPVHDLPPDRSDPTIKPADQAKIEQELIAARERQAQASAAAASGK
ncbi:hypothetical protein [Bradyrhizobium mercantei]|uniref:hypothetical protein n=1 Tax=Bradyrhizobium mercantei TaxID=1904807 RepID=UPI0009758B47|nr:hypothetical protein [Bradyrhizobium mercantei]